MIFLTMQDAVDELRPRINGGTCRNETAIARINQATRRIMNRPRKPIHVERVVRFFTRKEHEQNGSDRGCSAINQLDGRNCQ